MDSDDEANSWDAEEAMLALYMPVAEPSAPIDPFVVTNEDEEPVSKKRRKSTGSLSRYFDKNAIEEASKGPQCYNCNKYGHISAECIEPSSYMSNVECYGCGEKGHIRVNCPNQRRRSSYGGLDPRGREITLERVLREHKKEEPDHRWSARHSAKVNKLIKSITKKRKHQYCNNCGLKKHDSKNECLAASYDVLMERFEKMPKVPRGSGGRNRRYSDPNIQRKKRHRDRPAKTAPSRRARSSSSLGGKGKRAPVVPRVKRRRPASPRGSGATRRLVTLSKGKAQRKRAKARKKSQQHVKF